MDKEVALLAFISFLHIVRELVDGIFNNIPLPESNDRSIAENGTLAARF